MSGQQVTWDTPSAAPPQVKWDEAPKPQTQEQIDRTMGSPSMWQQLMHGRGTDEQSTQEQLDATKSGLGSVGRGISSVIRGVGATFDPKLQPGENAITGTPAGRMVRGIGSLAKGATEIPAAIHDINASPDPTGLYANAAQEAAGEGAGQALLGAATEAAIRGIPRISKPVVTAPVRLGARSAEAAINQKLVPVRPIFNIMSPADEAEATQFKVPGRDFGLPKPIKPAMHGPEAPPPEVLQARGLQLGGRAIEDPSAGLDRIPVRTPAAAQQNATQAAPQTPEEQIGAAIARDNAAPKPQPGKPIAQRPQATQPAAQALNQSLGGKPLVRGVSLRNQPAAQAAAAGELPEGFTPVDSSLLQGYKYNAPAEEFDAILKDGQRYRHAGVTPDLVSAFENADSKGAAYNSAIRNGPGVTPLGKVNANGTLVPRIPGTMRADSGDIMPKSKAGMGEPETETYSQLINEAQGGIRGLRLPEAFRSRSIGEEGIPYNPESRAQATMSESEGRQFMPGREETEGQPQELIRTDLSKVPGFSVIPREGAPSWVKYHAPVPESLVERTDLTPAQREELETK